MADLTKEPPTHDAATSSTAVSNTPAVAIEHLDDTTALAEKPQSFGQQAWKRFVSHRLAILGAVILVLLVLAFYIGPLLRPYEFDEINVLKRAQGPSREHWFGTDDIGRDLFVRAMRGGQFSIRISLITALLAALLGGFFGAVSGYFSGITDTAITFVINILLSINAIAILLILSIKFEMTSLVIAVLIASLSWTRGARVVRALVLQFKERDFVLAAKAAGATAPRIILRHLMPNILGALLVEATLLAGTAIILESTLSFLGLGVLPPETTLGTLIADAKGSIDTNPARVLIPGGIVTLIVLAINFLGDGLRDALDPTQEIEA